MPVPFRMPQTLRLGVLAALTISLVTVPVAVDSGRNAEAAQQPSTPSFGRAIDNYAGYQGATTCDPSEKPGAQAVRTLISSTYGSASFNISRTCSGSGTSEHHEGRAVDWMRNAANSSQKAQADAFISWLLATDAYGNKHAMARRLGVMYIIWNKQMWRAYDSDPNKPWRAYTGYSPHTDHVHISLSWPGARKQTSWYTGASDCVQPPASTTPPPQVAEPLGYVAVTPERLLDTRSGVGVSGPCTLGAGKRLDLSVLGRGGVPTVGVAAAVLNVTVVGPKAPTYIGAYPSGVPWPGTSSVNAATGATVAGLVVVPVGADGKVSLRNGYGRTDLVVDVVGYHPSGGGAGLVATEPLRAYDSRVSGETAFAAGEQRLISLPVPANTEAALVNLTAVSSKPGYLTAWSGAQSRPSASSVNFASGRPVANRAYVPVQNGQIALYVSASAHVVVDLVGSFGDGGAGFVPLTPVRILDSRTAGSPIESVTTSAATSQISGIGSIPSSAQAVVATVTSVSPTNSTWLAVWPGTSEWPGTSDVNMAAWETRANLAAITPGDGSAAWIVGAGRSELVVDVLGYFE